MSASLSSESKLAAPDEFYAALMDLHRDLDQAESAKVNAKLVLLLANHIGEMAVLRQALAAARPARQTQADEG